MSARPQTRGQHRLRCRLRTHSHSIRTTHSHILTFCLVSFGQSTAAISTKENPLADVTDLPDKGGSSSTISTATYPVLIRATNGKAREARQAGRRVKLATVVDSNALDAFYVRYAEICKAGMLALKPRDRSKRKTKGKKKKPVAA